MQPIEGAAQQLPVPVECERSGYPLSAPASRVIASRSQPSIFSQDEGEPARLPAGFRQARQQTLYACRRQIRFDLQILGRVGIEHCCG